MSVTSFIVGATCLVFWSGGFFALGYLLGLSAERR